MNICQSCGMPMSQDQDFGKNLDGTKNSDYCIFCYPAGEFGKANETLEEMVETCVPFLMKEGLSEEDARNHLLEQLKTLKRWS